MGKPVQRKRYKNKKNVTCEQCANCMYAENGDMYCDEHENFAYVYDVVVVLRCCDGEVLRDVVMVRW